MRQTKRSMQKTVNVKKWGKWGKYPHSAVSRSTILHISILNTQNMKHVFLSYFYVSLSIKKQINMKLEYSPEHQIRIKTGLILLVIILYFSGVFIYSYTLKKSMDTQKEEIARSYDILFHSNNLIGSVQQAQNIINSYMGSPKRIHRRQYDSISENIYKEIEFIKKMSQQEEQNQLLENIDSLLNEKNAIVKKLMLQFKAQNPLEELDKKVEAYTDIVKDSVIVVTKKDTTVVVKDKKSFWTRVKGLFDSRHAVDTTINITTMKKDTLLKSSVDTSMYSNLKAITQEASESYSLKMRGIERQVKDLIYAEQGISLQISQLLTRFYNQNLETVREGIRKNEKLTQQIFIFAVAIGALSLLLISIIILLIAGDLQKGQIARQELTREKQLTENLMESRHKLLLSVSHDIKTPLSSMMGYMEMWGQEEASEKKKQQLLSAQSSGKYMLNMLSNLLEFSRLEQNSGKLNNTRFDLIELVEEITAMFRPFTQEKNIEMAFESQTETPFYTETGRTVLKQILTNVISNAVKYTPKGSIRILLQHSKNVVFSVSDTGIGIDKKELEKICQPFSRIENALNTEGSGFGMYVTKGLVDSMKGNIRITSEKGKGTCVEITLPLKRLQKQDVMPTEAQNDETPTNFRNILIFEDDVPIGNMIAEFLSRKGFSVKVCSHIEEMRAQLNALSSYDIVFTDMQMLHVNGKDILRAVRKRGSRIPVWLMTAHDDYTTEQAKREGFDGFIAKPIQMSRFFDILPNPDNENLLNETFPSLTALFGDDKETIHEILARFVETSHNDTQRLTECIAAENFTEAQQICHKIHPFLAQLNADHLCGVLRKMDKLRGQNESAYPNWKEELADTIKRLREFADTVRKEYL